MGILTMDKLKIRKVKNKSELNKTFEIRTTVFIEEQNVLPELELDGLDSEAEHFIVYLNHKPIGCARIRKNKDFVKLERIAIIKEYRCRGFGKKLTNFLVDYCKQNNYNKIKLHSQIYISDFYKKLGFKLVGKKFFEAGIEHIEMWMNI